jgi:hypothetical protein
MELNILPQTSNRQKNRQRSEEKEGKDKSPLHQFNRTVPATTEPEKKKKPVQSRHPP